MKDDYNNYPYLSLHQNYNVSSVLSLISKENEKKIRFFHFKSQKREKVQERQFSIYKETIFHIQIPRFQTETFRLLFVSGRWPRRACACAPAFNKLTQPSKTQQIQAAKRKTPRYIDIQKEKLSAAKFDTRENLTFCQNCVILFSGIKKRPPFRAVLSSAISCISQRGRKPCAYLRWGSSHRWRLRCLRQRVRASGRIPLRK